MEIWSIAYRLKIRRKWSYGVLTDTTLDGVEARWEAKKDWAHKEGLDYEMLYKSDRPHELEAHEEPCHCGLDDVTPKTCPAHKNLV